MKNVLMLLIAFTLTIPSYGQNRIGTIMIHFNNNFTKPQLDSLLNLKLKMLFLGEVMQSEMYVIDSETIKAILDSTTFFSLQQLDSSFLPQECKAYKVKINHGFRYNLPNSLKNKDSSAFITIFHKYFYDPIIIVKEDLSIYRIRGFAHNDICYFIAHTRSTINNSYFVQSGKRIYLKDCSKCLFYPHTR